MFLIAFLVFSFMPFDTVRAGRVGTRRKKLLKTIAAGKYRAHYSNSPYIIQCRLVKHHIHSPLGGKGEAIKKKA
jgi:hypothetical protein